MRYFITYNGQTVGPMTEEQLLAYPLTPDTPICTEENRQWSPLYCYPELMVRLGQINHAKTPMDYNTTGKDHIVAGIFAIILGSLGAQYFYCGKISGGVICILLSLVTCGLWGVITLIQGIIMLTMTQQDFERKYVLNTSSFPVF